MRQLLVASEYGEPANYQDIIVQRIRKYAGRSLLQDEPCLLLISKSPLDCQRLVMTAQTLNIPTLYHFTITGLGGTKVEPHISPPGEVLKDSLELMRTMRLDPKTVTLRIDPLIPELVEEQMQWIPKLLEAFAFEGVRDCRISVMDYYPHVRARFGDIGIDMQHRSFQAGKDTIDALVLDVAQIAARFDVQVHLCAEKLVRSYPNVDTEGCASMNSWRRLGIGNLKLVVKKQRPACTCNLKKEDLLKGLNKGCRPGCVYCYWR